MIHKVEMFGATCDGCNDPWGDADEYAFWPDKDFLKEEIKEYGWHITDDGKTYCPNCYRFDDDDDLLLTFER